MDNLQTLAESTTIPPKLKMSWEEFLDWMDEDTHAEWVDGEIVMTSPASALHQDLGGFLYILMRLYARKRKLGLVENNPFVMRLPTRPSGREPDILFVRQEHLDRIHKTYLEGPADLVVEIISPESIGRDRGDKFVEYEQAGIPEYWLIDPLRHRAEFYLRNAEGICQLSEPDSEGIFHSKMIDGFWLQVDWLWQEPLPDEEAVLQQIRSNDSSKRG